MKYLTIASITALFSIISAQNVSPATSESYPSGAPVPKPEWLDLIKGSSVADAPVLKNNGANGPSVSGSDNFCDWAKSGCVGSSIADCPKGQWGLTYDDGPSDVSPVLYDFLKTTNQKATLFMIGKNVIRYPDTVKRAYEDGHEIAIHTWTHSYMTTLSNEQIVGELKWTELAIKNIIGVSPRLFRPPYGDIDNRVRDIATALGFTSVIWDHDTNDWMLAEQASFNEEWIDGNFSKWIDEASTATTGGLSLEHDIKNVTVQAAIRNLPALQQAYKVVTVGQCAGLASYKESNTTIPLNASAIATLSAPASSTVMPPTSVAATPAAAAVTGINAANNIHSGTVQNNHISGIGLFMSLMIGYYLI